MMNNRTTNSDPERSDATNTFRDGPAVSRPQESVVPEKAENSEKADVLPPPTATLGFMKRPTLFEGVGENNVWNEEESSRKKRTRPAVRISLYVALALLSFLFFLYITFPYGVIKEVVVSSVTDNLRKSGIPVRVSIGTLKPYWFTGLELRNVVVTNAADTNAHLKMEKATLRLNVLPLLIGKISVSGLVEQGRGELDLKANLPLIGALKGHPSPSSVQVEFRQFSLDPIFNHGLAFARGSKDPSMVLVLPLLAKTTAGGTLSGQMSMENSDTSNFTRAKGAIKLAMAKAFLHIDDQTLKIPRQEFSDAKIDLKFENNALVFEDTNFKAEDIGVGLAGKVTLPEMQGNPPTAELDLKLSMHGEIEKNLGFIIPQMLRCSPLNAGELKAKLTGPLSQMRCD
jgi:type II secretion system protein N